ncbi:MAG: hypothetical protein AAFW84_15500 [Cyanobacteria bacterium J06635_15]
MWPRFISPQPVADFPSGTCWGFYFAELTLVLSTVSRFFTGKPVDYATFIDICDRLGLAWHDIITSFFLTDQLINSP